MSKNLSNSKIEIKKYLKHKTEENLLLYTQQRNKCVSLLWKTKINYHGNLDEKGITVKPLLSDKSINSDEIHLNKNGELNNSDSKKAELLNNLFSNIAKNFKIPEYANLNPKFEIVEYLVFKDILKYKNHPSIIAIKEKLKNQKFFFYEVDNKKIIKEIKRLIKKPLSKVRYFYHNITIIYKIADIFAYFLADSLKGAIKTYNVSNCLKLSDITP